MWYYWLALLVLSFMCIWSVSSEQYLPREVGSSQTKFEPIQLLSGFDIFLDYGVLKLGRSSDLIDELFNPFSESVGLSTDHLLLLQHVVARMSAGVYSLLPTKDGTLKVLKLQDASIDPDGHVQFAREKLKYKQDGIESWVDTLRGDQIVRYLSQQPFAFTDKQIQALVGPCLELPRDTVTIKKLLLELQDTSNLNSIASPVDLGQRLTDAYVDTTSPKILTLKDDVAPSVRYKSLTEEVV